jgi:hypothetical protein
MTSEQESKFLEWFHKNEGFSLRSERFYDSLEQFSSKESLGCSIILWLQAAYQQGCKDTLKKEINK